MRFSEYDLSHIYNVFNSNHLTYIIDLLQLLTILAVSLHTEVPVLPLYAGIFSI
jgi:hypothetical protein